MSRSDPSPPPDPPQRTVASDDEAERRRLELEALRLELAARYRQEFQLAKEDAAAEGSDESAIVASEGPPRWLDNEAEQELRAFLKNFREKKERRKYQLSLIKDYLVDPSRFGPHSTTIYTSSTEEELEERKRELEFRIALFKTLLALAEEEFKLILQAEPLAAGACDDGMDPLGN